jgi:lipopolysaccharide/colanic/teichoic acid biosynthesis glycosyltransferase
LEKAAAQDQRSPRAAKARRGEASLSAEILAFPETPSAANEISAHLANNAMMIRLKRVMDIGIALCALIVFSPFLILIASLIRLTSAGPALFRQRRTGLNGREFTILKFRTMYSELEDRSGVKHTVQDDPRVTPVGRFLRKYSIDELPQLWNVVVGDMSIVGPRAHAVGMLALGVPYDEYVRDYNLRHLVRPGLTGQAQVKGYRGEVCDEAHARGRVAEDLDYVRNVSLWRDVKIMALTLPAVLSGRAAF